jgi:hypothetical protein
LSVRAAAWLIFVKSLIGIGIGVPIALAIGFMLQKLQAGFCDSEAFLAGPTQLGELLLMIPWLFAGIYFGIWIVFFVDRLIRQMYGVKRPSSPGRSAFRFPNILAKRHRGALWTIAVFGVLPMLISFAAMPSYFCVAKSGVTVRKAIWTERQGYGWDSVKEVIAKCHSEGRSRRNSYTLVMTDDNHIDLATSNLSFAERYPQIRQALRGKAFEFTSVTPEKCPPHLKSIFTSRPG